MNPAGEHRTESLAVYLLDEIGFEDFLAFQRRLVYEISGDRSRAALVLCEHSPLISVGRHGSRSHIHLDQSELNVKGWPIRWVNRGGGCLLHAPGQLAVYPIFPLDRMGLGVPEYLSGLRNVLHAVTSDACVRSATVEGAGIAVDGRMLAQVGIAVRDWVSYFGAAVNVAPDLEPFRRIQCGGSDAPMTSMERERRLSVNPALIRQRIVERMMERFDLPRVSVFHHHPALPQRLPARASSLPVFS